MVVISLGGSIVNGERVDIDYILKFREFMEKCEQKLYVVVGGGETARRYISYARALGMDEYSLDEIGIIVTRLNAKLLVDKSTSPEIPVNVKDAMIAGKLYKNVVMGGTAPGHTTDGVSLLLAEKLGETKVINMTFVGGIYTKDPRKYGDAELISHMDYDEAKRLISGRRMGAGLNVPVDLLAIKIAERSNIKIYIIGKEIENLEQVIKNEDYKGTVIGKFDS